MANIWTDEQQKVIDLHDRNILVSAAAGSGKTAVLVERIIKMITREKNPIDIDRLVIVTFTNMAAYEMRMRILAAIEKRVESEPDNKHLKRQLTLVHNAKITTIDSFCLNIVKSYFNEADLDPAFRVAQEGELKLISADVMKDLLEEYYASGRDEFYEFVDAFAPSKTDKKIEEYILKLYKFSQSYPWPENWLKKCLEIYHVEDADTFMESDVIKYMVDDVKSMISGILQDIRMVTDVCNRPDGPYMYLDTLLEEEAVFEPLVGAKSYDEIREGLNNLKFGRLSPKKDSAVNQELKEFVKSVRDNYKKTVDKLKKDFCLLSSTEIFEQTRTCAPSVEMLTELTIEYIHRIDEVKREKKIITFNDMEHIALDILVKVGDDGTLVYSNAADELAARYDEILIDEYQDSNMVQELILNSISKERFGRNNVFMVGDVKQSIYKFRLARPELFVEKYNTYSAEDSLYQKIELHKNFRSRKEVLDSVNAVFFNIMTSKLGGVEYDDNVRLNVGAFFPESDKVFDKSQIYVLEHEEDYEYSDIEAEAAMVAGLIVDLVSGKNGRMIFDKETDEYRTPKLKDIVILLRSLKGWADSFVEILNARGIPAYSDTATGYFSAVEIRTLLSFLAVVDNPRQDIALAAVMKSYFGGFSEDEMARIRGINVKLPLYDVLIEANDPKVENMLALINTYREYSHYMEISRIIWKLAYDTGFYDYVGSMPAGTRRQANISMLVEKARQFESTSYKGLFHFLRYIEKLKSYEVDFAGASQAGEDENIVRIMSIHKSKGLEFPIVILSGMTKGFNNMDSKDGIIMEPDYGIGIDYVNVTQHVKKPTVIKKSVARKMMLDNLAEEQRILYVALTRAKEHLIMTGHTSNLEKSMEKWNRVLLTEKTTYNDIIEQKNYMDMVMSAAIGNAGKYFNISVIQKEAFSDIKEKRLMLLEDHQDIIQEELVNEFIYPYKIYDIPVKMSVSEIKHMGMGVDDELADSHLVHQEIEEIVPAFLCEEVKMAPAARGSAYHALLEHLDYERCQTPSQIREQINELCANNLMSKEWGDVIREEDIIAFANSSIGIEAAIAADNGKLFREKQFMTGIAASEIFDNKDIEATEQIIVQGIIDMYYETPEGIVLVDYKTDRVQKGEIGRKVLVERYKEQLKQYKYAIQMILNKKVVRVAIYSFALMDVVDIDDI